jgi:AcrR family transcriptional regulator
VNAGPEAVSDLAGLRYNSNIVATACEQICNFSFRLQIDLVGGSPRRDMISFRAYGEDRYANVGQRYRLAADHKPTFGKIVVEKKFAQILRMHAVWQARRVGIPCHEIRAYPRTEAADGGVMRMRAVKRGRPLSRDAKGNVARERLLQAGYAFIAERPFDSVTVDEIADAAGVAHGLLFHYFGSKQGLYLEIMRDAAEQLEKIHLEQHPLGVPPEEMLAAFLHRHMDFIRRWPTAYALYSRGALSAEVREIWEQSKQRALRIVLRYFEIPQPTRRQLALARAWLAFFDELVLAWLQTSTIGKESVVQISVDTFRDLISRSNLLDGHAKRRAVRRNSGHLHARQA